MKDFQYMVYEFEDPKFPIVFEYIHQKKHEHFQAHWHTNLEVVYLLMGEAKITVNDQVHMAKTGDIVIFNTNDIHRIDAESDDIHYYSLVFDNKFCNDQGFDTINNEFNVVTEDLEMRNIFQIIGHEMNKEKKYYQDAVRALSITMLILLFRNQKIKKDQKIDTHIPQIHYVKDALEYIHNHYHEDLSLDMIADYAGVSKYHFSRVFKDVTSLTINQYINNLRCKQARQLLLTTELSVSEIAEQTGFRSVSYFTKAYKRLFSQTPTESRKESTVHI